MFGPVNNYVWTCDCPDPEGAGLDIISRVEVDDPPGAKNSAAQVGATLRCALRQNVTLTRVCEEKPSQFEKRARQVLQRCISVKPNPNDKKVKGPFTFNSSTCEAFVVKLLEPGRSAAVWLCLCRLPAYRVIPARASFSTTGSPIGEREEVLFLETCSEKSKDQMTRVCQKRPETFQELGTKKLQRCCKRARKGTEGRKLCMPEEAMG